MVPGTTMSSSPEYLLEMQIPGAQPRAIEAETSCSPATSFKRLPGDFNSFCVFIFPNWLKFASHNKNTFLLEKANSEGWLIPDLEKSAYN